MTANYVEIKIKASDQALPDLAALRAALADLSHKVATAEINADDKDAVAKVTAMNAQLARLDRRLASPRITLAGAADVEAKLAAIDASFTRLTDRKVMAAAAGLNQFIAVAAAGAGVFGALSAKVSLFGGAFGKLPVVGMIGGFHLLAESVIETAATLLPAAIAFTAFGAAAVPTIQSIVTQMRNLHTVEQATGMSAYPLTGAFSRMADAVKPQVYQLFGDALEIAAHKGGAFAQVAKQAGTVVDQLASRFTLAMTSGKGFGGFLRNAAADLSGWGNLIGNIGGIFGNFMKVVPGYAASLLGFAGSVTHVAETVTGSWIGQKVLGVGLAFHGAAIWAGLAATTFSVVARTGLTALSGLAMSAGIAAEKATIFGGASRAAAGFLGNFAGTAEKAAGLPWGWIAIAAAGIGILAYKLITAKDATQQWLSSLQATIAAAPVVRGMTDLLSAQAQVAGRLRAAHAALAVAMRQSGGAGGQAARDFGSMSLPAQLAAKSVAELTSGQRQLADESSLFTYRLGRLSAAFGGTAQAMGLLKAAGVTTKDMLDPSKWAQIVQEVRAVQLAYQAMGQQAGVLGADMNALTIAGSSQVTSMTQLNQAWDATLGIISGGQGAFVTFQQDLLSVNQSFAGLGGPGRTATATFGQVQAAAKAAGATMEGLNAPSLQLRSTWQAAYAGGLKLTDALRMMSSASPGGFPSITRAVRDTITQLMPFGKESAASRAELVAMAQDVNPAVTNFRQLTAWLGHSRNAGADLNKILAAAGMNLQDVAKDASVLASAMQSNVTQQFSMAKMAANGTDQAISDLANAMSKAGYTAAQKHADMVTLYYDLRKDGYGAQQAAEMITALTGVLFKVPKSAHIALQLSGWSAAMQAVRSFEALLASVPQSVTTQMIAVGGGHSITGGQAHGGITGAATGGLRSGMTLVGEYGPELISAPPGSRVWNNAQAQAMLSGASGGSAPQRFVLELDSRAGDKFLVWLRESIRIGGGNVQTFLGHGGAR